MKYEYKIPNTALFNKAKFNKLMSTQIRNSLLTMTSVVQTNISFLAPTGVTSQLKDTIGREINKNEGSVFSGVKYAYFVEHGRAPGRRPPLESIMRWLQKSPKGRKRLAAIQSSKDVSLRQAAFMVAIAIEEKGTRKNPFFSRGIKESENKLRLESGILLRKLKMGLMK